METLHAIFRIRWFYIAIIILQLLLLCYGFGKSNKVLVDTITKTDTVYIDRPYEKIVLKEVIKPKKVFIYKTDTVYRKQLESEILINGIELNPQVAKIHTISPNGILQVNKYKFPPFKSLTINPNGQLQIEPKKHPKLKKKLRKIGAVALFVGGVYLGSRLRN